MNIVVTGASKGIGYEMVKRFSADPNNRILALSRNKDKLLRLKNDCKAIHPKAQVNTLAFDIAHEDIAANLLPQIARNTDPVDVLINNAGHLINKPFDKFGESDFDAIFDTNIKGVFRLIQSLLPYFSNGSHIVNISSMGGFQGSAKFPGLSLYSASKGALAILTECLAEEFKERKIYVNCLALGAVRTEMLAEAFPDYMAPLKSEEMAEYICNFALTGHRFYNGKILPVALSTP